MGGHEVLDQHTSFYSVTRPSKTVKKSKQNELRDDQYYAEDGTNRESQKD